MKVVMVSSEALPFCKVGGLADVVYSLSKKLVINKINASIILPLYKCIKDSQGFKDNARFISTLNIDMSWRKLSCDVYCYEINNVTYYLIGNEYYFSRKDIYGESDDFERFAFFSLAAYKVIKEVIKKVDIVHIHDWQGAAVSLLHHHYKDRNDNIRFMLTIHNPAFQGICDRNDLWNYFNLPEYYFDNGLARLDDKVNLLKAAICLSDIVTTVSPTHRDELRRGISSYGLEKILPSKGTDFVGVLNGLDTKEFNPTTDRYIYANYNKDNVNMGKKINKEKLMEELGLKDPNKPLFCIVSRLTHQKGISFIVNNIQKLLKLDLNLVILGKGEKDFENQLSFYCDSKENACCLLKYSNELAHKIYAASDFLLMPSKYEPCGIAQLIALRYGTIPIASKVGGLKDTIVSYNTLNEDIANGLLFNFDDDNFLLNVIFAIDLYSKKRIMSKIIHNAMNSSSSWTKASKEYIRLYRQMIQKNKLSK